MKLSYSDQLKHPNWQRVRLEVLSHAEFHCEICGDGESTLHVHHKQYIKGRMAWEYDISNFEALCETCHEDAHRSKDVINQVLAAIPAVFWNDTADLLIGWASAYFDEKTEIRSTDPRTEMIGSIANRIDATMDVVTIEALLTALSDYKPFDAGFQFAVDKRKRLFNDEPF